MMDRAVYYIAGSFWDEYLNQTWMLDSENEWDTLGMWCMGGEL